MHSDKNGIFNNDDHSNLLSLQYKTNKTNESILEKNSLDGSFISSTSFSTTVANTNETFNNRILNIDEGEKWINLLVLIFTASIMIFIIVAAIFGNLLVIISVMRNRKLRWENFNVYF